MNNTRTHTQHKLSKRLADKLPRVLAEVARLSVDLGLVLRLLALPSEAPASRRTTPPLQPLGPAAVDVCECATSSVKERTPISATSTWEAHSPARKSTNKMPPHHFQTLTKRIPKLTVDGLSDAAVLQR